MTDYEFSMEHHLQKLDPDLYQRYRGSIVAFNGMLEQFHRNFPEYTDHSIIHAINVVNYANYLIGDNIEQMNAESIYTMLMACYMHDFGMQISSRDYEELRDSIIPSEYMTNHPDESPLDMVRTFHHEFSKGLITKYAKFFEIPSDRFVYAIVQVARGHRKTDLYDDMVYNRAYEVREGQTICLPYLAAIVRLADEIDCSQERSAVLLDQAPREFSNDTSRKSHALNASIRNVEISPDAIVIHIHKDIDDELLAFWKDTYQEILNKFDYCQDVIEKCTPYELIQREVREDFV